MIPGANVLNQALSVIAAQTVAYHKFTGRVLNDIGTDIAQYAAAQMIRGSFQPVPRRLIQQYGLDFNSIYYTLYASKNILDVQRDVSADQISFCGNRFQVLSANDWSAIDGWTGVLCVQIGAEDAR